MPDQPDDSPAQLPNHKVKYKKPLQRACNEKNDKGKFCGGHLKRWFYTADVVEQGCGDVRQAYGEQRRGLPLRALQDPLPAQRRGAAGQERGRRGQAVDLWRDRGAEDPGSRRRQPPEQKKSSNPPQTRICDAEPSSSICGDGGSFRCCGAPKAELARVRADRSPNRV